MTWVAGNTIDPGSAYNGGDTMQQTTLSIAITSPVKWEVVIEEPV
jgi:hypothetical protein